MRRSTVEDNKAVVDVTDRVALGPIGVVLGLVVEIVLGVRRLVEQLLSLVEVQVRATIKRSIGGQVDDSRVVGHITVDPRLTVRGADLEGAVVTIRPEGNGLTEELLKGFLHLRCSERLSTTTRIVTSDIELSAAGRSYG